RVRYGCFGPLPLVRAWRVAGKTFASRAGHQRDNDAFFQPIAQGQRNELVGGGLRSSSHLVEMGEEEGENICRRWLSKRYVSEKYHIDKSINSDTI
ncbi:MAG: hypothetical protein U9R69_03770, partial [Thermodesulfobacteriota bacterium]|nr:hypothetical protein [Thermodesulfobacteriota bacterium]